MNEQYNRSLKAKVIQSHHATKGETHTHTHTLKNWQPKHMSHIGVEFKCILNIKLKNSQAE